MRPNRVFIPGALLVLVLALLTACGTNAAPPTTSRPASPATPATAAGPASPSPTAAASAQLSSAFPSYHIQFASRLVGDPSGRTIPLAGNGVLTVTFRQAQAHTASGAPSVVDRKSVV